MVKKLMSYGSSVAKKQEELVGDAASANIAKEKHRLRAMQGQIQHSGSEGSAYTACTWCAVQLEVLCCYRQQMRKTFAFRLRAIAHLCDAGRGIECAEMILSGAVSALDEELFRRLDEEDSQSRRAARAVGHTQPLVAGSNR